ncbi:MAG: heme o synthase [Methylacidiphilales bacterium]|nr:heme o synthase [Candidatus Methylacidiphilales bacterium]
MNPAFAPLPSVDDSTLGDRQLSSESAPSVHELSLASDLSELTKARLTVMVLLTTLAGFCLASHGVFEWSKLGHALLGTALVAICSSILNQALERDSDALMRRTQVRPFVTRRLPLTETILAGLALGAIGLVELACFVNGLTALLSAVTLVIYVFIYTPLKRVSEINTLVGAIPGALPPLIGATAALGKFSVEGWTLFAILACWQLPHFYAIAWMYRDDYRAAGLRMVSTDDATGRRTATHAVVSALVLLPVSLLPAWIGHSGLFYAVTAGLLSLVFIAAAIRFARQPDRPRARTLFLTSIIYLPLILTALAVDVIL